MVDQLTMVMHIDVHVTERCHSDVIQTHSAESFVLCSKQITRLNFSLTTRIFEIRLLPFRRPTALSY